MNYEITPCTEKDGDPKRVFGTLEDCPPGRCRYYMKKALVEKSSLHTPVRRVRMARSPQNKKHRVFSNTVLAEAVIQMRIGDPDLIFTN